jgi:hypothetical protein
MVAEDRQTGTGHCFGRLVHARWRFDRDGHCPGIFEAFSDGWMDGHVFNFFFFFFFFF